MKFIRVVAFCDVLDELTSQGPTSNWARYPIEAAQRQFSCWSEYSLDKVDILAVRLLDSCEFGHELGITVEEYCERLKQGKVKPLQNPHKYRDRAIFLAPSEFDPDRSSPEDIEGYRRLRKINTDHRLVCLDGAHRLRKWALSGLQEARAFIAGLRDRLPQ